MSGKKIEVNVHSKLTVVSDTPVQPGKTYPLSVLDHAMGKHTLHIIFYYRYDRVDKAGSSDLGRLRASLSDVLSYYPPVTGRLMIDEQNGNWVVKCNDAGVRVLKAKVNCTLDEWLMKSGGDERDLTAWEDMPNEDPHIWSPFRIQLNDFEGGGLAIGLSCPHMYADPHCATILMKSWTDIYRRQAISYSPFFHPPGLRGRTTNSNTNTKSAAFYAAKSKYFPVETSTKMSSATFRFSDSMVKKHLSDVQISCPNTTAFEFLTALFWSAILHVKSIPCKITIGVDFRKLLEAPLPNGFFGNALHFSSVECNEEEIKKSGSEYLTKIVHEHCLSSHTEEEFWSAIDWFESQKDDSGKFSAPFSMYGPELTSLNLEHMFAYGAALDDKKPLHVSYHIGNLESEGLILVVPSQEEGLGRTVMVTLPEDQIANVCQNEDILRLEPIMLVSGRQF
ncbi:hypothetical protein MKW98_001871 [Papaver atlanticum]|uniref:Uncharacterized protein n=1 Tax=Papaver atlanticum TaxID=357466 RepID=A0AAD4T4G3_9MAGN|nr:hypothetical protein MKW98_001871 [Papaver atlanticum]